MSGEDFLKIFIAGKILFSSFYSHSQTIQTVDSVLSIYENENFEDAENFDLNRLNTLYNNSKTLHYKLGEIRYYFNLGKYYYIFEDKTNEAIRQFYTCISLADQYEIYTYNPLCYKYIGIIYYTSHRYRDALTILQKIDLDSSRQDYTKYYMSGHCYLEIGKIDSAILSYNKAITLGKAYLTLTNLYECKLGLAKAYIHIHEYRKALNYINESTLFFEIDSLVDALSICYELKGRVFYKLNEIDSALYFGLSAYKCAYSTNLAINRIEINELLASIYFKKNDYQNAYNYLRAMQALKDTMSSMDISSQIALAQAKYDFDKEKSTIENDRKRLIKIAWGFGSMLLLLGVSLFFVRKERQKSEKLLLNILPEETAQELKKFGKAIPKRHDSVTVLFCDVKEFSRISENLPPEYVIEMLDFYFSKFDEIVNSYPSMEKIKTIGDAYMCAAGLHDSSSHHALDAVNAACDMMEFVHSSKDKISSQYNFDFQFRAGIHTGRLVSGVVGSHKYAYDIWGNTVNIAARMETAGEIGKINISEATCDLIKEHFNCSYRGQIEVKNKEPMAMYFVEKQHSRV